MKNIIRSFIFLSVLILPLCFSSCNNSQSRKFLIGCYISEINNKRYIEITSEDNIKFFNMDISNFSDYEEICEININDVLENELDFGFVNDIIYAKLTKDIAFKVEYSSDDLSLTLFGEKYYKK